MQGRRTIPAIAAGLVILAAPQAPRAADVQAAPADDALRHEKLSGDWAGRRAALSRAGLDIGIDYAGETIGVASGGIRRGWIYDGKLELSLDADLARVAGWTRATAHVSAYQLHGRSPSPALFGNLLSVSNIEAQRATRLNTLWLEQTLFGDRLSVRAGQLAADDEFLVSDTAANLMNGTFGWAAIAAADMASGGPAYPLPAPGIRVRAKPSREVTALAAVFSGDPAGRGCVGNPQVCNRNGTTFSFSGGALLIGEVQYAVSIGAAPRGLPGVYKVGGWYETGDAADQHFGVNATGAQVSLADPDAVGSLSHRGNFGLYAIADQMVWREVDDPEQGLSLFVRIGGAPSDRNLVSLYVDGGFGYKGLIPSRNKDILAFGAAYAGISPAAADFDRDARAGDPDVPVRDYEAAVELTYIAAIAPWCALQADLQYIVHPGGKVRNPNDPTTRVDDAVVLGLRTTISF